MKKNDLGWLDVESCSDKTPNAPIPTIKIREIEY